MTSKRLSIEARDEIYTELCTSITECAGNDGTATSRTELFLSRFCLLLIEQVGDPDMVRDALRNAKLEPKKAD